MNCTFSMSTSAHADCKINSYFVVVMGQSAAWISVFIYVKQCEDHRLYT